jgi:hypothetical protein
LQRPLALFGFTGADEHEATPFVPTLRLPVRFKEAHVLVDPLPPGAPLNLGFQFYKALERYRDRIANIQHLQRADDLIAEEGAVHAYLEDRVRQDLPDFPETTEDETLGSIGVMHVTGTMPHIKHLPGLRHGTEQRIVAALTFLLAVVANRRTSAIRQVPTTEPSKSNVSLAGAAHCKRSSTNVRDIARSSFTAVLSTPANARLTVATSGRPFNPNTRCTIGSSR